MNNIEKTNDYNKFKYLTGNRPIDKGHIKRLKISINKNNQLNLHPIIVNSDYEIIDGQHRFEVAKEMQIEIYYIKSDTINDEHLIECNVNQKLFQVENYIDFFAVKEKNPEYIQLKDMLKATSLKPKALITLILGVINNSLLEFLKTGKFKFPQNQEPLEIVDFYLDFMSYTKDKRISPTSMFSNHNFTRAFRWLHKTSGFNSETFFKKLDLRWFDLKPKRNSEEWYELLISIYNFKNQTKIENEYALDR